MRKTYIPTWESIKSHPLPSWYDQDKLGIFIHWGAYSVPAFASGNIEFGAVPLDEDWFMDLPYAEWYFNSLNIKKGPTYEHHRKTYGEDFPYEQFAQMWKAEHWSPEGWAQLFKEAGAKYVVLTTKHHDGFCLFNSRFSEYTTVKQGPKRDIMRELSQAVGKEGMRMGAYYSGIIDWKHAPLPIFHNRESTLKVPATYAYADVAFNQMTELIEQYQPSILWNDIGWPKLGEEQLPSLLSYYYNSVPEGLINDRWNGLCHDFITKEYKHGEASNTEKWEMCRGLGLSFGYNAFEDPKHLISSSDLIRLLIHTVSMGGNLLINVGPRADGVIPEEQVERLLSLGEWLKVNGEAIYGTSREARGILELPGGVFACFTRKGQQTFVTLTDIPVTGELMVPEDWGELVPLDHRVRLQREDQRTIIKERPSSNLAFRMDG